MKTLVFFSPMPEVLLEQLPSSNTVVHCCRQYLPRLNLTTLQALLGTESPLQGRKLITFWAHLATHCFIDIKYCELVVQLVLGFMKCSVNKARSAKMTSGTVRFALSPI